VCVVALRDAARPTYWEADDLITVCCVCAQTFGPLLKLHHCRACGKGVCAACSPQTRPVPSRGWDHPVRVCKSCYYKPDAWSAFHLFPAFHHASHCTIHESIWTVWCFDIHEKLLHCLMESCQHGPVKREFPVKSEFLMSFLFWRFFIHKNSSISAD